MTTKTKAEIMAHYKDKLTTEEKNAVVANYEKNIAGAKEHNAPQSIIANLETDLQLVKDNLF
jgi:hypothetical protein